MDIQQLKLDEKKSADGVWFESGIGDIRIKVRRLGNTRYKEVFQRLIRPYRRQIDRNALPEEVAEQILSRALSSTVLVDWENLTDGGEPVECTPENAYKYLLEFEELRAAVQDCAGEREEFRVAQLEESAKN